MRSVRAMWMRLFGSVRRARSESEFEQELQSHVAMHTDDGVRAGLSPAEARRQALLQLGGAEQTRQAYRERRSFPALERLAHDLRYALRQIRNAPGFAIAAVCTLALAIGANTAIFSVVEAVLHHPAGIDRPDRVAVLKTQYQRFNLDVAAVSVPGFAAAAGLRDLVESAAIESGTSFNILHNGAEQHVSAAQVSQKWFQVFGALPILGRTFAPEEDQPHAAPTAVLSYGLWQEAFGGSRDAIGKSLMLDGRAYRVIGVMRSDFAWPRGARLWTTLGLPPEAYSPDNMFNETYFSIVRLRLGVAISQFSAGWLAKLHGERRRTTAGRYLESAGWSVSAPPLTSVAAGGLRKPLLMLLGIVALVLLIASANVAGLFLARASARSREFAIRAALGASAYRMTQQLFVETALLAGAAAVLGAASGPWMGKLLLLMVPQGLAEGYVVRLSPAVLAFTAGVSVITALVAGVGPALKMIVEGKRLQLHEGTRSTTTSHEKQRMRSGFVIAQVAISFLLLTGTGLFVTSLQKLQNVDPGFNPKGVLAATVNYAGLDFKADAQRQATFVRGTVDALAADSRMRAAAAIMPLPFAHDLMTRSFQIAGRAHLPNDPGPHSAYAFATSGYLRVMETPLLAGRWLTDTDRAGTQPVAVIDERLARKYWPHENPIGQHILAGGGNAPAMVVGVVANVRSHSLEQDTEEGTMYYPFAQMQGGQAAFVVRTDATPGSMASVFKNAVTSAGPAQAVATVDPLKTLVSDSLAGRRLIVWMLAAFAGLALLLTVIGIYGLISYVTAGRVSEIGIRMALGAQRADAMKLVLGGALRWVLAGLALGGVLSLIAVALLRHAFEVFGAGLGASLIISSVALCGIGIVACAVPARRAASVNPAETLRAQ